MSRYAFTTMDTSGMLVLTPHIIKDSWSEALCRGIGTLALMFDDHGVRCLVDTQDELAIWGLRRLRKYLKDKTSPRADSALKLIRKYWHGQEVDLHRVRRAIEKTTKNDRHQASNLLIMAACTTKPWELAKVACSEPLRVWDGSIEDSSILDQDIAQFVASLASGYTGVKDAEAE